MVLRPVFRHLWQSNVRTSDFSDKLNSTWTALLLLISSFFAWYYTFQNEPITCWGPPQLTENMINYMHKECWEAEWYYTINQDFLIPQSTPIGFRPVYKWLPLILFLQALLFKFPDILLSAGQGLFGFKFKTILGLTDGYASLNLAERRTLGRQIGRYVKNWLRSSTVRAIPWGPLTLVYLLVKILYVANIITQTAYLQKFLKVENQTSYGEMMADDITYNETSEWRLVDPVFQKNVICPFAILQVQNMQRWQVQCKLNFATFYEGIYSIIWAWFVFTTVVTCLSTALYVLKVIVPIFRKRYVALYVKSTEEVGHEPNDGEISQFVSNELNEDGILILKAVGEVSSELLVKDIIIYLWTSRYIATPSAPPHTAPMYNPAMSGDRGGIIVAPPQEQPIPAPSGAPVESIPLVKQNMDKY